MSLNRFEKLLKAKQSKAGRGYPIAIDFQISDVISTVPERKAQWSILRMAVT